MRTTLLPLFAHQSGWDELLLFVGLVALVYVILRIAEKRARLKAEADRPAPTEDASGDPGSSASA